MKLTTATQLAKQLGRPRQTVRAACVRLGITPHSSGIYLLTPRQCRAVEAEIGDGPGRKPKQLKPRGES